MGLFNKQQAKAKVGEIVWGGVDAVGNLADEAVVKLVTGGGNLLHVRYEVRMSEKTAGILGYEGRTVNSEEAVSLALKSNTLYAQSEIKASKARFRMTNRDNGEMISSREIRVRIG